MRPTINKYGPVGSASFSFDEAFNVMAQGKAYSYITYNFFRAAIDDPSKSAVVGKVEIMPVPGTDRRQGGSLNGAWGWAIPKSSPNPDAAWTFLKWVESPGDRQEARACRAARRPAPTSSTMPRCNAKYPYAQALKQMLLTSHNFPVFTYTPQIRRGAGPRAEPGGRRREDAGRMRWPQIETEFDELAKKDGKLK